MSQRTFAAVRIACAMTCWPCAPLAAQVLDLAQYAHTAWRVQDGAPGAVKDLTQTADGVLWIASARGLFQFDGVRFDGYVALGCIVRGETDHYEFICRTTMDGMMQVPTGPGIGVTLDHDFLAEVTESVEVLRR